MKLILKLITIAKNYTLILKRNHPKHTAVSGVIQNII